MKVFIAVFTALLLATQAFASSHGVNISHATQVATRSYVNWNNSASTTQFMSRTMHVARDRICSLQTVNGNWYINTTGYTEAGTGATTTITEAVEYPVGTVTQVKFSGSASGTIASGTNVTSDPTTISGCIPAGATFYTREYLVNPNIGIYSGNASTAIGDCAVWGTSGVVDQTMSTTVTGCFGGGYAYFPTAIIANTQVKSYCLIGDSRTYGAGDTVGASGDMGNSARYVGQFYGYINMGVDGDSAAHVVASHTLRAALANSYCSNEVVALGTNDTQGGTLQTNLQSIWGYFSGKTVVALTLEPYTSSTDTWQTSTNQTISADFSATNTWLKAQSGPPAAVWDVASIVGLASKWIVNGTANYCTSDGIHETQACNLLIMNSGAEQ